MTSTYKPPTVIKKKPDYHNPLTNSDWCHKAGLFDRLVINPTLVPTDRVMAQPSTTEAHILQVISVSWQHNTGTFVLRNNY